MSRVYDALIIGGGPAGLSTALALARLHRTCAVFTTGTYRNDGAHAAHAIVSRDAIPPAEIRRLGRENLEKYSNTDFFDTTISSMKREEAGPRSHFVVGDDTKQQWKGRSVVMATGVKDIFPDLPGYKENWPHNIYQCPVCDGHELADQLFGVLTFPTFTPMHAKVVTNAVLLSRPVGTTVDDITDTHVTLFTSGPLDTSNPEHVAVLDVCDAHGVKVDQRRVTRLEPSSDPQQPGLFVHLEEDKTSDLPTRVYQRFLLHKPPTDLVSPSLVEQLGLETATTPYGTNIKIASPMNATNVPGVFVAGDAGNLITLVSVAMAGGIAASAGVAYHVNTLDDQIALERLRERRAQQAT